MTFREAISNLDTPSEKEDFGKLKAVRIKKRLWLIKSKFGLHQCTNDWPIPYAPSIDDIEATDWEIEN